MEEHSLLLHSNETFIQPRPRRRPFSSLHLDDHSDKDVDGDDDDDGDNDDNDDEYDVNDEGHDDVKSCQTSSLLRIVIWKLLWMIWQAALMNAMITDMLKMIIS